MLRKFSRPVSHRCLRATLVTLFAAALLLQPAFAQYRGQDREQDREQYRSQERSQDRYQDRGQFRQGRQQDGEPGKFDFYVLSLSWSPSYCEATAERSSNRRDDQQCGPRPYSFVVHGLWPQYERGFPSFCQVPAPRLSRDIMSNMLDLMPSPRLVYHEWDRHGTCSGLEQQAYFENVRKARASVSIPTEYQAIASALIVKPGEVADAFVKANTGLTRDGLSVTCDSTRLSEVRICMNKDLSFRDCPAVVRRSCRRDGVVMPPVRGARAAGLLEDEPR